MFKASRGSLPRGGPILLTSIALTIVVIVLPVVGMASGKQVGYAGGVAAIEIWPEANLLPNWRATGGG